MEGDRRRPREGYHDDPRRRPSRESAAGGMQIRGLAGRQHPDSRRPEDDNRYDSRDRHYYSRYDRDYYDREPPYPERLPRHSRSRSPLRRETRFRSRSRSPPRRRDDVSPQRPRRTSRVYDEDAQPAPEEGHRSPRGLRRPSTPSDNIILHGLGSDVTEAEIRESLNRDYGVTNLDDVRILRAQGRSGGTGFLRFPSMDAAQAFLEPNYPNIHLRRDASAPRREVAIDYSRPKQESDWTCPNEECRYPNFAKRQTCRECGTEKQLPSGFSAGGTTISDLNTGDKDVSTEGSIFLLFRSLALNVNEEMLAKGAAKLLNDPSSTASAESSTAQRNPSTGLRSSTATTTQPGARPGSLRRILLIRDRKSNQSWRFGFAEFSTIEDAKAALARYQSLSAFTIASNPVMVSFCHNGVFVPGSQHSGFAPFFNESVYVTYRDLRAYPSDYLIHSDAQEQEHSLQPQPAGPPEETVETKSKKRKADRSSALPTFDNWNSRQAELRQPSPHRGGPAPGAGEVDGGSAAARLPTTFIFPGYEKGILCCLCRTIFKTEEAAGRHEAASPLHQRNIQDPEAVRAARTLLEEAGLLQEAEYRDRAAERRREAKAERQRAPREAARDSESDDENVLAKSKGFKMMAKMGYAEGRGLGTSTNEGSAAPIPTQMFRQGVGLGAEGGMVGDAVEEAERRTREDSPSFLEKTRDAARERFKNLS